MIGRLDAFLLAVPVRTRHLVIAMTLLVMVGVALRDVPRAYVDYTHVPILNHIPQHESYGPDTIADVYESKVILNDPRDMYTKRELPQTPLEAATWTKEASAPYPPAVLLAEAGLYALGARSGLGFYGVVLGLMGLFFGLSIYYFLSTRWYLFPVLYLNFLYVGYRFVYVQDNSYLIMLVVITAALVLARARRPESHALMALAIIMKLSPLAYLRELPTMRRRMAVLFVAILVAGLVLPYFVWDNYLYIYRFNQETKGRLSYTLSAIATAVPFTVLLWYVQSRLKFDIEDRLGWSLVPFAMFLGIKMNAARHVLIVLLVPDKRGFRNIAAAAAMALQTALPGFIRFGALLSIVNVFLFLALVWYLDQVGWHTVRQEWRRPLRTIRSLLSASRGVDSPD